METPTVSVNVATVVAAPTPQPLTDEQKLLEKTIKDLCNIFGTRQVNLIHSTKTGMASESVWVVPCTDSARQKIDGSTNEKVCVRLLNKPANNWCDKKWGDLLTVTTRSGLNPDALEIDNRGF